MSTKLLTKKPTSNLWVLVAQTSSFGVLLPLLGSVLFYLFFPQFKWSNEPLHALIETLGGFIAISVAGLLFLLNNTQYGRKHHFWIGCGLISMGILDIFHAGVPVGNTFVWFHSLATFLGGGFLGLVWIENKEWVPNNFKLAFAFIGGISFLTASVFIVSPELAPDMLHQDTFTITARALNILGGIGFLIASAWLAREVCSRGEWEDYFLLVHCLLFGSAGILFELSELWDGPWWWWHFLRLLAYIAVFGFALKNYQQILDELKNFNDHLNLKIKERTKQLEETTLELEVKNKELSSFASITSHDLKNPIRKITNYCAFIEDEEESLSETTKQYLNNIELAANHARNLIEGILEYSKLGQDKIEYKQLNLNEIVSQIIKNLELELAETKGKIEFNNLPDIFGNEFQIKQLFENLISNSLKYRKKDVPPFIKIYPDKKNRDHYQIIVEDNGIGFDNIFAAKIFDPFQRLDGDINTLGSGLGLSICKKIMLGHLGNILAEGEINSGAKFKLIFSLMEGRKQK